MPTLTDRDLEIQRIAAAYGYFETDPGKLVISDLEKAFGINVPAFLPQGDRAYDPIHAAIRDGQRSVLLHMRAVATKHNNGETTKKPDTKRD
jgi:hypothetical protein